MAQPENVHTNLQLIEVTYYVTRWSKRGREERGEGTEHVHDTLEFAPWSMDTDTMVKKGSLRSNFRFPINNLDFWHFHEIIHSPQINLNRREIQLRYLKTWFVPDLLSSIPFDIIGSEIASSVNGNVNRSVSTITV